MTQWSESTDDGRVMVFLGPDNGARVGDLVQVGTNWLRVTRVIDSCSVLARPRRWYDEIARRIGYATGRLQVSEAEISAQGKAHAADGERHAAHNERKP